MYIWYERAEDGGPTLNEGFEHIVQVNADSDVQSVLQVWQEFNPAMSTSEDVLLRLKQTIRPSQIAAKADGMLSLHRHEIATMTCGCISSRGSTWPQLQMHCPCIGMVASVA